MRWSGSGLTARALLATFSVALVSILMTAIVAMPIGLRVAQTEAKKVLMAKTEIAMSFIQNAPMPGQGQGAGTGPGTGDGSGPGVGGTAPGTGSGTGPGTGQTAGPGTRPGGGQSPRPGAGQATSPGAGRTPGPAASPGTGGSPSPGAGSGVGQMRERNLKLGHRLRLTGLEVVMITNGEPDTTGLPKNMIRKVASGGTVDCETVTFLDRRMIAEGRPLETPGDGIIILEKAVSGTSPEVWDRLWLALVAGLAASLVAGLLLARRQAKPISEAAAAARRMSGGDRTVRLPVKPPNEVADLARALNDLAAALSTSEGRQREFLLGVSHELRTPLTTIRGYAEALSDGVITADDTPGAGRTILGEADRLDRLVSDLLSLARLEAADFPVELVAVELGSLITAAAEAWRPRCVDAGLDLRVETPDSPVLVRTDPGRLRQVVDILISNAVRALPDGAPLVLAVRPGTLEVRDGGPGLADEDLAVAFEQGVLQEKYRDVRQTGSGIGLALAARLVRRMGAEIEAGHAAEGGARFTIRF